MQALRTSRPSVDSIFLFRIIGNSCLLSLGFRAGSEFFEGFLEHIQGLGILDLFAIGGGDVESVHGDAFLGADAGMMVVAVFGNIVTRWSWFGTNMLGVGLYFYSFTDAGFFWLSAFTVSQLVVMGLGLTRGLIQPG